MQTVGAVVIGRNEGERLVRCLDSLQAHLPEGTPIVYVDSGSTDGSCEEARKRQIHVVPLDLSRPFTAARARNAGWEYLVTLNHQVKFVQFLDGDCQLVEGWIEKAVEALKEDPKLAVVCGRRLEQDPDSSIYNRLADMEWNTPIGEADACGGDALIRTEALQAVRGYDGSFICGEEPEMCIRLKRKGWKIRRLDADMTLHDAAMYHFDQWWKRSTRAGWAVAEGRAHYGNQPEAYMKKESFSGWLWGAFVPLMALGLAYWTYGLSLLLLGGYLYLGLRIFQYRRKQHKDTAKDARLYAVYCVVSKFPQLQGQIQYWRKRWMGRQPTLIEYKGAGVTE